jgi:Ca-activated chloride channel family protein
MSVQENVLELLAAERLWWLLALALLSLLLRLEWRSRRAILTELGLAQSAQRPLSYVALPCTLLMLAVVALARPVTGYEQVTLPHSSLHLALVVDVSNSMLAKDLTPNRLEVAKRKLFDLLEALQSRNIPLRASLTLFAGDALLFCPPTEDLGVLPAFIRALGREVATAPGSSLKRALEVARDSHLRSGGGKSVFIVLSDGEDLQAQGDDLAAGFGDSGFGRDQTRLFVLGLGGDQGVPIELTPGSFVKDSAGKVVLTKLEPEPLSSLASSLGGSFIRASLNASDTQQLLQAISNSAGSALTDAPTALAPTALAGSSAAPPTKPLAASIRQYYEQGPQLLALCLLLVLIFVVRGRAGSIFCWLITASVFAGALALIEVTQCYAQPRDAHSEAASTPASPQAATSNTPSKELSLFDAQRAYQAGDYALAEQSFRKQLKRYPQDATVREALAASLYRQGRYAEAQAEYATLSKQATNAREKFRAEYQEGNSNLLQKKPQQAIENYQRALAVKPDDQATRFNLELARKMLENPPPSPSPCPSPSPSPNQSPQSSPSPSPSPQPSGEPSPDQSPSPDPSTSSSGSPSPSSSGSAAPSVSPTASPSASASPQQDAAAEATPSESPELPEEQARKWLEGLPDNPLLPNTRKLHPRTSGGQTW